MNKKPSIIPYFWVIYYKNYNAHQKTTIDILNIYLN